MPTTKARSRKKRVLTAVVLVTAGLVGWVVYDLYAPRTGPTAF